MAASRIAGITVEIGGDTTKLSKALSGALLISIKIVRFPGMTRSFSATVPSAVYQRIIQNFSVSSFFFPQYRQYISDIPPVHFFQKGLILPR